MIINGKEANLKLDFGAIRMINKQIGKNLLKLKGEDFADPEVLAAMIHACAVRGKSEINMEDIDSMSMDELVGAKDDLEQLIKGFAPEAEGDPLAKKRRK